MRRLRRVRDRGPESGMSVIEVVLLSPLVIGFLLFLVCFGVLVDAHGTVQGASRDAARMGSLQRDSTSAIAAARAAAAADLGNLCTNPIAQVVQQVDPVTKTGTAAFAAGDLYTIEISCDVSLAGLDWFNLGQQTVIAYSTAPLDVFRRTG